MKKTRAVLLVVVVLALGLLVWPALALAETVETERVSVDTADEDSDGLSQRSDISADGQYVAFESMANDLVAGDATATQYDVFVRDLEAGTTELVSVDSDENQSASTSNQYPAISPDGRYVAFNSIRSDLVDGDTNGQPDVFVRDLLDELTIRVSLPTGSAETPAVQSNNHCTHADITTDDDNVYVVYQSPASNLVSGDSNGQIDVFLTYFTKLSPYDLTTIRMNVTDAGAQTTGRESISPSVAVDGDNVYVAYHTYAQNLISPDANGAAGDVFVSSVDKTDVAGADITTKLASRATGGEQGDSNSRQAVISADGRYVAYYSESTNLAGPGVDTNGERDVYVTDWNKADAADVVTERVSVAADGGEGDNDSWRPSISSDGRYVAFESYATNLVEGDMNGVTDIFVRDRVEETTTRVSTGYDGSEANGASTYPKIASTTGKGVLHISFDSEADNLVKDDGNGVKDVFVASLATSSAAAKKSVAKAGKTKRYEQDDKYLLYTGEWTEVENKELSKKALFSTDDPEATITITFKGTQLDWIASLGPDMGKALVSLDGGEAVLVDLHGAIELLQQVVWSTGVLEYGIHTVTITFPEGDDYVEGSSLNVDAFDIYDGYLMKTEAPEEEA